MNKFGQGCLTWPWSIHMQDCKRKHFLQHVLLRNLNKYNEMLVYNSYYVLHLHNINNLYISSKLSSWQSLFVQATTSQVDLFSKQKQLKIQTDKI